VAEETKWPTLRDFLRQLHDQGLVRHSVEHGLDYVRFGGIAQGIGFSKKRAGGACRLVTCWLFCAPIMAAILPTHVLLAWLIFFSLVYMRLCSAPLAETTVAEEDFVVNKRLKTALEDNAPSARASIQSTDRVMSEYRVCHTQYESVCSQAPN
jgi:hypothetical protein